MRTRICVLASLSLLSAATLLTGCSSNFDPMAGSVAPETSLGTIQGKVHGGHQADIGAAVYVYQTGVAGYKSASKSLLGSYTTGNWPTTPDINGNYYVTTDAKGNFNISGEYTCTSGTQVYIYVLGGNTGGGSPNANAGFLAMLGACPASGTLSGTIASVYVNEVSTVAMAYAMAGYAADPTHVGGPALSDTLGQTGIKNAALTAANLFNIQSGGSSPGALLTTPGGNGTVPQAKINSIANSLAACVNTTGSNATTPNACNTLLGDALSAGTTGTPPTDTASAAINIAHYPEANTAAIFGLATGTAIAYAPLLTTSPPDFTLCIAYTGGGLTTSVDTASGDLDLAEHSLTIDGSGNIWEASGDAGNVLSGFTNLGVPLAATGFTNASLNYPVSAVLDSASANIWLANSGGVNSTGSLTTLSVYNIAGNSWTTVTPMNGTAAALNEPNDVGFDGAGNIWVASANNSDLVKLTSAGAYTAAGINTAYVAYPLAVAAEAGSAGNIFTVGESTATNKRYAAIWTNAAVLSLEPKIDYYLSSGIAIDGSGNGWVADEETYLSKVTSTGTVTNYTVGASQAYIPSMVSDAVDGSGNVWIADFANGVLYEYSNAGTALSGKYGFQPGGEPATYTPGGTPPTGYVQPYGIAVDGSGNVWFSVVGIAEIEEMVGAGTPVVTPLAYGTANSMLGTTP